MNRGFTYVELLVTIAIVSVAFGALISFSQFAMKLIGEAKLSTSALALANQRIEFIRSLPYNQVGTIAGIPSGSIPQNSTTSLNGATFHERVVVQYVDSPDDGIGGGDSNGILADYKEVKVEYSWSGTNGTTSIFLLTNVVPPGIETTDGGGTLTVNVFDAAVAPVAGAEVRVRNNTTTTTIDTIRYTNSDGIAMFAGAPAAANYEITVTKDGYSTDATYSASVSNPNPTTPHVAIIESAVSTMNFQIDEESTLTFRTVGDPTTDSFDDDFSTGGFLGNVSNTETNGSALVLTGGAGAYSSVGTAYATATVPGSFDSWDAVTWTHTAPANTGIRIRLYTETAPGTYTLVPDTDLPGNAVGFETSPIPLNTLSALSYPALVIGVELTSSDVNATPELDAWSLSYIISEPRIGNVPFALQGMKTIGTTGGGVPVYKYAESHTTNGSGEVTIDELEWDSYTVELTTGSYTIREACAPLPYALAPGVTEMVKLRLITATPRSLRVTVTEADGDSIAGADVILSRSGFSENETTTTCGQVYFDGMSTAVDYSVEVSAPGYTTQTITDVSIDGTESLTVTLVP